VQCENAFFPISMTDGGMVKEVIRSHQKNAFSAIEITGTPACEEGMMRGPERLPLWEMRVALVEVTVKMKESAEKTAERK
jgi:hypothetical protein